jgi:hypothetical protein
MPHFGGSRRRFLKMAAAGLSAMAASKIAKAQFVSPVSPGSADGVSTDASVSIEVKARPIPWFDRQDHGRVRFGELEYRSGLVLTSPFPRFGGLSGLRSIRKANASFHSVTTDIGSPGASCIRAAR